MAALVPAVNIIKMLLLGLGIWKDDATVKSMSRFGDHRLVPVLEKIDLHSFMLCCCRFHFISSLPMVKYVLPIINDLLIGFL